ncbi:MAG: metallophosphoesterase [Jatrophihabitans sp.]|uniref:metallophosphoesterase n=1 Tax=Jatrophihabitans sp. TaxID=1932789 RepID=UPI003F822B3B
MPNRAFSAFRALGVAGAATFGYAALVERNAFTLRRFDVPVLPAGTAPIRILHLSDVHILTRQQRKQAWIRDLATLQPDLVVNTGDTLSSAASIPGVMHAFEPLFEFPGVFVPGNNDYFAPTPKLPTRYFMPGPPPNPRGAPLPWPQMAAAMAHAGWVDLTHQRTTMKAADAVIALAGTDDPHLRRAKYELIEGPADPHATVRIGVTHSPEPALLRRFAADGYDLVLAGHTHGGQVRVPFGPALVTNCGIDRGRARWLHEWDGGMLFHISAGLGTNPYSPVRFACRPEATLLTLVPR